MKPPLSKRKRALFVTVTTVGVWLVIEIMSAIALRFQYSGWSHLRRIRSEVAKREPSARYAAKTSSMMLHPYLGWVMHSDRNVRGPETDDGTRVTEFGFLDDARPIHRRRGDLVIVAILGGSVARQLASQASPILERELAESPVFAGRKFRFVRLAVDGFKQPQQLMTLNYLMSLGAEFDIVINLDGVNESALPQSDNVRFGVAAAFPRKWSSLLAAAGSPQVSRLMGYVTYLRECQRANAVTFDAAPWKYSAICNLIWSYRHWKLEAEIRQQSDVISQKATQELSLSASGPPEKFESDRQLFEHCVNLWSRSSILLNSICRTQNTRYFHFLQPSPHLPDSKPLNKDETAFRNYEGSPFRVPVQQCYPLMRAKADELRAAGVTFHDLTQIFADNHDTIYVDDCCHVNQAGDAILATAIAKRIREQLESP